MNWAGVLSSWLLEVSKSGLDVILKRKLLNQCLGFYHKKLEKEKQVKPKARRRKDIIKTRTEISNIENKNYREKCMKLKADSLRKKISGIDKTLARLAKRKRRRHKLTNTRNEIGASL